MKCAETAILLKYLEGVCEIGMPGAAGPYSAMRWEAAPIVLVRATAQ